LSFINPSTGQASSGAQDSGGRAVNTMFAKPLSSSPDTMSGVPDDVVGNRYAVTVNQQSGANRAYAGLDSSSLLVTGVGPGATIAGANAAIVASGASTSLFRETCDDDIISSGRWTVVAGATPILNTGAGIVGPNIETVAAFSAIVYSEKIPYNPSKLHRIRVRIRQYADGGTQGSFFVGLRGFLASGAAANTNAGAVYVCVSGLNLHAADGWQEYTGFFIGASVASTSASSPSSNADSPAQLNANTVSISPYVVFNNAAGNGTQLLDYLEIDVFDEDASGRVYGAIGADANLQQSTLATNGSDTRVIAAGQIRKVGLVNGGSVSFTGTIVTSPTGIVTGGVSYEPGNVWGTAAQADLNTGVGGLAPLTTRQIDECYLYNVTSSGCNVRARLRQVGGSLTSRSDTSWSPSPITSVGSSSVVTSANAPAYDDNYTANFAFDFKQGSGLPKGSSISVVVSLDYYNGSSWVSTATATFSSSDPGLTAGGVGYSEAVGTFALSGSVAGRVSTSQFRLTILSVSVTGGGSTTLSLTPSSLSYSTSGADQYATKTPTGVTCVVDIVGAS